MGLANTFRLNLLHYCYVGSGILSFSWSLSGLRFSEPFGGLAWSSLIQMEKTEFCAIKNKE